MKINRIYIAAFGGLKNKTIDVEQIIINMSDDEELFYFIRKMGEIRKIRHFQ